MRRKESLYAVIGGCVGAVLTMAMCSVLPLGAQNEAKDAEFGAITCESIRVVSPGKSPTSSTTVGAGVIMVSGGEGSVGVTIVSSSDGGIIAVRNKGGGMAKMMIDGYGGRVEVYGKNSSKGQATMGVNEYGNGGVSTWDKNGYRLATLK